LNNSAVTLRGSRVQQKDLLNWTLSSECTNATLHIEQSTDGFDFNTINQFNIYDIASCIKKMDLTVNDYQKNKTIYYRIKVTKPDGKTFYSNVIALKSNTVSGIQIFPNPVSNQLRLTEIPQTVKELAVFNQMGQIIHTERSINHSTHNISASEWNQGIYYLRLIFDNGKSEHLRIIKQ
ncbi:MAG: T9SS type A sorting domain-containing protein, partial [Bacteroidota bacterium]